jgi:hypothetical protein
MAEERRQPGRRYHAARYRKSAQVWTASDTDRDIDIGIELCEAIAAIVSDLLVMDVSDGIPGRKTMLAAAGRHPIPAYLEGVAARVDS